MLAACGKGPRSTVEVELSGTGARPKSARWPHETEVGRPRRHPGNRCPSQPAEGEAAQPQGRPLASPSPKRPVRWCANPLPAVVGVERVGERSVSLRICSIRSSRSKYPSPARRGGRVIVAGGCTPAPAHVPLIALGAFAGLHGCSVARGRVATRAQYPRVTRPSAVC